MDAAVRAAVKDEREGAFTWSRRKAGAQVVPLVAMSLGLWWLQKRAAAGCDVLGSVYWGDGVSCLAALLELLGLAAIVAGVAFIFWPAALVVAGVAMIWVSRQVARV